MFPYPREQLGRYLGPLKNEGNEMAQALLKSNGEVVPRRTVRRLTEHELISETEIAKRKKFDQSIKDSLGDSLTIIPIEEDDLIEEDLLSEPSPEEDDAPNIIEDALQKVQQYECMNRNE